MRVRILKQLNGAYGTFAANHVAELPEHIASAWIEAGVAERAVTATTESEPEITPQPRRRGPPQPKHPSSHDGPSWSSTEP